MFQILTWQTKFLKNNKLLLNYHSRAKFAMIEFSLKNKIESRDSPESEARRWSAVWPALLKRRSTLHEEGGGVRYRRATFTRAFLATSFPEYSSNFFQNLRYIQYQTRRCVYIMNGTPLKCVYPDRGSAIHPLALRRSPLIKEAPLKS